MVETAVDMRAMARRKAAEKIVNGMLSFVQRSGRFVMEKKQRVLWLPDIVEADGTVTAAHERLVQWVEEHLSLLEGQTAALLELAVLEELGDRPAEPSARSSAC